MAACTLWRSTAPRLQEVVEAAEAAEEEAGVEARRARLLHEVRQAKAGGAEQRKLMARWNRELPPRNAPRYPPPPPGALPIVLLVYERVTYLEVSLRLLSLSAGINATTLVVSHQGTQRDVWERVRPLPRPRSQPAATAAHRPSPPMAARPLHPLTGERGALLPRQAAPLPARRRRRAARRPRAQASLHVGDGAGLHPPRGRRGECWPLP